MMYNLVLFLLLLYVCPVLTAIKRPLKILFVVNFFPKRTETFILNQITRLIDRGHDIWIHAYEHGNKKEIDTTIKQYHLLERTSYGEVCPYDIHSFDILYCQFGMMGNKMLKQKRTAHCNTKLVTCFRGYDITRQLYKYPHTYERLLKEGDLFLPVCDFFAQELVRLGADAHKVIVHHSAIDCASFLYTYQMPGINEDITIISVARLIEKKGIEHALYAVASVIKKYPNVRYIIIGDGYLKSKLYALARTLGIQKHVIFKGSIPHEQVMQLLNEAHLFLLPSIKTKHGEQEGIPNALKEAMACGIPVISTLHAGIPELIEHGICGLLSPERNNTELVKNILYCIENPYDCVRMGCRGREKVMQEFNLDILITKLEDIFYTLIDAKNAPM